MPEEEKELEGSGTPPEREEPGEAAEPAPEEEQPEEAPNRSEKASLKTKLEQMEKKMAEAKDALLRTAAEYDNFRKRSAREHDAAFDNGVTFAVTALLPVLDTLELAAAAPTADENYKKGVTLTLDKCREAYRR